MIICKPWTVTQFELKKLTKVAFITVSGALFTWGRLPQELLLPPEGAGGPKVWPARPATSASASLTGWFCNDAISDSWSNPLSS
jgi:hypothetical protein